jgi:hypothetical protein
MLMFQPTMPLSQQGMVRNMFQKAEAAGEEVSEKVARLRHGLRACTAQKEQKLLSRF